MGLKFHNIIISLAKISTNKVKQNTCWALPNNLSNVPRLGSDSQSICSTHYFPRVRINFDNSHRIDSGRNLWNKTTSTSLAVYVDDGGSSFSWAIKFPNLFDAKAGLELFPNLRPETVAKGQAHRMLFLSGTIRLSQKVAANLTNVLNDLTRKKKKTVKVLPLGLCLTPWTFRSLHKRFHRQITCWCARTVSEHEKLVWALLLST